MKQFPDIILHGVKERIGVERHEYNLQKVFKKKSGITEVK